MFGRNLSIMLAVCLGLSAPSFADDAATAPDPAAGLAVVQIEAGGLHTCALIENGQVYCWGDNGYGQLGDGTGYHSNRPVRALGLENIIQISAGYAHSCAVRQDGAAFCWGFNRFFQLGDREVTAKTAPVRVLGVRHVSQIVAGSEHTCALVRRGRVMCWGRNHLGQLGRGTTNTSLPEPAAVRRLSGATAIFTEGDHTCATRQTGRIVCWGQNDSGQLGDGTRDDQSTRVAVSRMPAGPLATGLSHTCALHSGQAVPYCWGWNGSGQLGNGDTSIRLRPTPVRNLRHVRQIATGYSHSCAIRTDGKLFCWGDNTWSQLGNTRVRAIKSATRVLVSRIRDVTHVTAGSRHTCAVVRDGRAFCWGENAYGQVGNGSSRRLIETPRQVAIIGP